MRPKITNPNVAIVYHFVLQVHSIMSMGTAFVPLICCNAILVTKDFNFASLHIMYITINVTTNNIITVMNKNTSIL